MEYSKSLIDRLQAWHLEDRLKMDFMDLAQSTYGIFFYLDLVVIEKRPIRRPFHVQIGN